MKLRPSTRRFRVKKLLYVFGGLLLGLLLLLTVGSYRLESISASKPAATRISYLEAAQLLRPLSPLLHGKLSLAYLETGRTERAVREADRILRPRAEIRHQVAAYHAFGRDTLAQTQAELALSPPGLLIKRLRAFLLLPDTARAAAALDPADEMIRAYLSSTPSSKPSRLIASSRLLRSQGLLSPAERFTKQTIALLPQLPLAWQELAEVYLTMGRVGEAKTNIDKAISLDPIDPELFRLKALTLTKLGDTVGAKAASDHAARLKSP